MVRIERHFVSDDESSKPFIVYFNGEKYDLRSFIDLHPGGDDILRDYENQDVTQVMKDIGIHEHSATAYEYLQSCKVHEEKEKPKSNVEEQSAVFDLSQPLLKQLWTNDKITREAYLKEIHTPILSKKSFRLFGSPFFEFFTKTTWHVIPLVWIPIVLLLCHHAYIGGLSPASIFRIHFLGLLSWSLIEYVFHRFLFHCDNYLPKHRYAYTLHYLIHGIHHHMPLDPYRLVMPPVLFVVLLGTVLPLLTYLCQCPFVRMSFLAGILSGYVAYDMTHYYLHHANVITQYMRSLKAYHMDHHFKNPDVGFGVTSKFWDLIFGT